MQNPPPPSPVRTDPVVAAPPAAAAVRDIGPAGLTLHAGYCRALLGYLRQRGINPGTLYSSQQLHRIEHDAPGTIGFDEWVDMMVAAENFLGDPDLALRITEHSRPWHVGVLGFALMTSPSVQDVGHLLVRFHRLLTNIYRIRVSEDDEHFKIQLLPNTELESPRLAAMLLGTWAWRVRFYTGRADLRFSVNFEAPCPARPEAYAHAFGGVLSFHQNETSMTGERGCLDMAVLQRDASVNDTLCAQAAAELERLELDASNFALRVRRRLSQQLMTGPVSLDVLASGMRMAPRTLQERLEPSGHTFRSLLETTRQSLAKKHLGDPRMSLTDISFALGFANQSAFQHAFKRWTGMTPGEWRRRRLGI